MKIIKVPAKTCIHIDMNDLTSINQKYLKEGRQMSEIIEYVKTQYPLGFKPSVQKKFNEADEVSYSAGTWGISLKGPYAK